MYIKLIECPNCKATGRIGESHFQFIGRNNYVVCSCGTKLDNFNIKDQLILSSNPFCRLIGASNSFESGQVKLKLGESIQILFKNKFELFSKAFFYSSDAGSNFPLLAKEVYASQTEMTVICGCFPEAFQNISGDPIKINWSVFGLTDIDKLPIWYIQFYNGITNLENGFYKGALIDYAISFEAFIENYLSDTLTKKYDKELSSFLLKSNWKIEERCKSLLQFATGKKLSDRDDVYQPWDKYVRQIRNRLFHGEEIAINKEAAENAHIAVYQAIRFIQNECK